MSENYIRINDIVSFDRGDGCRETGAEYQICIMGINRKTVVGVLSKLLEHMEISPLEILLYRDSHNSSDDRSTGFKIVPELLEFIDGFGAEGDDNPSVSGGAADSPTPLSAACGGISPRRGESALCTREPLEDEA